jgi:ABC-2 type transport system ATP-binding protein
MWPPSADRGQAEGTDEGGKGAPVAVAIRTEGLSKHYGSAVALAGLDLEVTEGEVFGFLGPNGAGKSTTIGLLLGFIRATAGRAEIFGLDVRAAARSVHRRIGYVPSTSDLWPSMTGAEVLRFLGRLHGGVDRAYRDELIERFQLEPDKKIRAYSHGNRQKVSLIAAFAGRPDLLVMDEPTGGLDPLMERVFQECVDEARDAGRTVFLSSHILSEVDAVCDRVAMLRKGSLIEVGDLDVLRGLASVRVEATLEGPVPDLSVLEGVDHVTADGHEVGCDVTGPMGPLLEALTAAGVSRLTTHEPSLEELFVTRYGDTAPVGGPSS